MSSVHTETLDPQPQSKHASPLPTSLPSNLRLAHVISATPAKRITFYKSGDSQFEGVRMAVHNRSFKCFDALLDDLSQKVPLPFGVRTVTTPRGTHTIKHLEQLQDGGCYLCSDQRQAKPINMELLNKRPNIWYHQSRRPHRPECSSTSPGHVHLPYRQRRILLVKNSEPGLRRSVVLSRRSTRSLGAFLDEASEVMQFHVRKLYTVEGRKIDNVQTLMTCPSVLICVGREAFSPTLVNFIRKSSEEKMPSLGPRTPGTQGVRSPSNGAQSRASEYSEDHGSKKNVNFGLETKKSIIHPRSDSSTRSTRFSLSSEKSYGVSSVPHAQAAIMNDDIEKRVLVNKDGTLSVEMRVRFRLHSDETLQWSTQIKKSPSLTNDCCPLSQAMPHYLQQGQPESCSDPDSTSFDREGVDNSNQQYAVEEGNCPCCYLEPEPKYDLWENPANRHKYPPHPPPHCSSHIHTVTRHTHSSSSSSSCNSRRVVCRRARLSNCRGGSGSEHSQLVQEEMCVTEQVEHRVEVEQDGDKQVEVCKMSQSCSRCEVIAVDSSLRPLSGHSGKERMTKEDEEEERPPSAVSSSSRILQSFKEDQDDEDDDDLPPSASQCCHNNETSPASTPELINKAASGISTEPQKTGRRAASSCCSKAPTPHSMTAADGMVEASNEGKNPKSDKVEKSTTESEVKRAVSGLSGNSKRLNTNSVCPDCGGCRRSATSNTSSRVSQKVCSKKADATEVQSNQIHVVLPASPNAMESRASSVASKISSRKSAKGEDRIPSAASTKSRKSIQLQSPCCDNNVDSPTENMVNGSCSTVSTQSCKSAKIPNEDTKTERPTSSLSAISGISAKTVASNRSKKSNRLSDAQAENSAENMDAKDDDANTRAPSCFSVKTNASFKSVKADRADGTLSAQSNVSAKSGTSHRSTCSHCTDKKEVVESVAQEPANGQETDERPLTSMSMSNLSVKSNKSCKSTKASDVSLSPRSEAETKVGERVMSQMSVKSVKSNKSGNCNCNEGYDVEMETQKLPVSETKDIEDRVSPAISERSQISAKTQGSHRSDFSQSKENDNEERVKSAMSVKSKSSQRSKTSHTSNSSKKPSTLKIVTVNTPNGIDAENEKDERAASVSSPRSNISSILSHESTQRGPADITVTDRAEDEMVGDDSLKRGASVLSNTTLSPRRARSSHNRTLKATSASPHPGMDESTRSNAVSVKTPTSVKSGRSECSCGAASGKTDKEEENDISIISCSSKRQPVSRHSSQSVSLGLPEDQDTAESESGKSNISINTNNEDQDQDGVKTATSGKSHKSESIKNYLCSNVPLIDIPTIQMPDRVENGTIESEDTEPPRSASEISVKSIKSSHKSSCDCSVKRAVSSHSNSTQAGNNVLSGNRDQSKPAEMEKDASAAPDVLEAEYVDYAQSETKSKTSNGSKGKNGLKSNSGNVNKSKSKSDDGSVRSPSRKSLNVCHIHSNVEACNENTASAVDPLKENLARPTSQQSKVSKKSQKHKSESSRSYQKERNQKNHEEVLSPACLPNASPGEVVSDWLRSIPENSSMLAPIDTFEEEDTEHDRKNKEETHGERKIEEQKASPEDMAEREEVEPQEEVKVISTKERENVSDQAKGDLAATSSEAFPKNWQSSAAVMKVLLSSSLGRCRSMPEVSPIYGHRLSSSAKGLLDCLAELQLIGPTLNPCCDQLKEPHQQYDDIMAILHSIWLTESRSRENNEVKVGVTEVTSPISSSGVGMSSGSNGSGKDNGNQEGDEMPLHNKIENKAKDKNEKASPEEKAPNEEPSTDPQSLDSLKAMKNPSVKSSANESSKSPNDNDPEMLNNTSSETLPTVRSKKMSPDPDPMWVLHLLKKLEKQFMGHYIDAMAEFKVRWDLDDSLILDRMICELRDEVGQRIQKCIEREIKKIQSRAGKTGKLPRPPPGSNLSRESTMTDRRRRMLKVMKNQSVKTADSHSPDDMGDDFSDQRSEDDYCPCDTCVRKKMAARPLKENPQANPLAAEAPMMMEFDLLKILQLKKSPVPVAPPKQQTEEVKEDSESEKEERSLEVVQEEEEEEEETKEDVIAEEVKEEVYEEDIADGETEKKEIENCEESNDQGREEVKGESSEKEDEESEEVQCHCQVKTKEVNEDEETSEAEKDDEMSPIPWDDEEDEEKAKSEEETGTGEDEEEDGESTIDTVKEATPGAKDTIEEAEDEEEYKGTASESQPEEEEDGNTNKGSTEEDRVKEGDAFSSLEKEDGGTGAEDEEGEAEFEGEETPSEKVSQEPDATPGVTEGEEADAENSDIECKHSLESGGAGDQEEEEDGGSIGGALLHQTTRTSVESQQGSLDAVDSPPRPLDAIEVPKMGGGGSGNRRSRSPARVKRRKPAERETDNF